MGRISRIIAALTLAVAAEAAAQQPHSPLIGSWDLVSYVAVGEDGSVTYPAGPQAIGHLSYSAVRMAVQIVPKGDPSGPKPPWVQEGYLGYFGTYIVDPSAKQVTNILEAASYRPWVGSKQLRNYTVSEDQVTFEAFAMGYTHRLIWKRTR